MTKAIQQAPVNRFRLEARPAPAVYSPQKSAVGMQRKVENRFQVETRPAPPVYRPQNAVKPVQAKQASQFRVETRPAPPVYRPEPNGSAMQRNKAPAKAVLGRAGNAQVIGLHKGHRRPAAPVKPGGVHAVQRMMSTKKPVGEIFAEIGQSFSGKIKDTASKWSVAPESVFNMAMDMSSDRISSARDLHRNTFKTSLQTCNYTSCVESARMLFKMIGGNPGANGSGDYVALAKVVAGEKGKDVAILCIVGQTDHGFVIVIQGDDAEILQSFAGESGAKLVSSFAGGSERRAFPVDKLVGLLLKMDEEAAQMALFGGLVDSSKAIEWAVAALKSENDIAEAAETRLFEGLKALKK